MRWLRAVTAVSLGFLLVSAEAWAVGAPDVTRLPPVSIAGAPRSLVTFSVALPQTLEDAELVQYSVELRGTAEVLGRLEGNVGGMGRRQILLTLRVPADARVGLLDVADVVFRTADGRVYEVPIVLRVPAVRVIRLVAPPMFTGLRQGDRLEVTYRVQNLGNAGERVRVRFDAPPGWVMRSSRSVVVGVEPFSTQDVTFRLAIPAVAEGGEYALNTTAVRAAADDSTTLSTAAARLQLEPREISAPGLELRPFVAAATSRSASGVATGFSLMGPVADSTHLSLTVMPVSTRTGEAGLGLAGVGAAGIPVQATITAPAWTLNLGTTSANFSDLTGLYVVGAGAHASYARDGREIKLLAAKPFGGDDRSGTHLGVGAWWETGLGRIGGSVTQLQEDLNGVRQRDLTAVGADWRTTPWRGWVADAGVAARSALGESGLGARAQVLNEYENGMVRLRIAHAPGGSRAFANGLDNLDFEARHSFSERNAVSANLFSVSDNNPTFGSNSSYTSGIAHQYRVTERAVLRAQVLRSEFSSKPAGLAIGAFGSATTTLGLGTGLPVGEWQLNADARTGLIAREAELFSGAIDRQRAQQVELDVSASRGILAAAQLSFGGSVQSTGPGVGMPAQMRNAFVSVGGLRIPRGRETAVTLYSRVGVMSSTLQEPMVSALVSATSRLPMGMNISASVERNPFFRDQQGRPQWIAALRVSTSTTVFVPQRLQRVSGTVFEDLNGNGKRDAGERGVPGVVLRLDGVRLVTEEDGVYRSPANVRGRLVVDPLGLPAGFVPSPRAARNLGELRDIPLVQTGTLRLTLSLAADAEGRVPQVDVTRVQAWVVDADGLEWVGRTESNGEVVFENVPTGRYSFRYDFSRLSEPLRAEEGVLVEVAPQAVREVTVTLRGRNVRLTPPPNRLDGRGNGRGGSGGRGGARQ